MNIRLILSLIVIIIIVLGLSISYFFQRSRHEVVLEQKLRGNMIITSPTFQHNGLIPFKYTCDGENINPPLEIKEIPQRTKSLALIVDDPDAPMETWIHWVVWNVDPKTTQIPENNVPDKATEGQTSFEKSGYGGPCPPSGTHRYFFKLYSLDTKLNLPSDTPKSGLLEAMANHILAEAELVGLYSRVK